MSTARTADLSGLIDVPLGNFSNADARVRAMSFAIRPLWKGARCVGRARTVSIPPGDNRGLHELVPRCEAGDVVVVDMQGSCEWGPFGEILATNLRHRGVVGLVIDGTVRDGAELEAMAYPVFCRGLNPTATAKKVSTPLDTTIRCGGVDVSPGDLIAAGYDGVVVVPQEAIDEIRPALARVASREQAIMAGLAAGQDTVELFGLV